MLDYLATNPLLALAIMLALGLAIGKIQVFGVSLGAAAVLFVALGLATANPDIQIPSLVYQLGLAMFVYVIGLSSGPVFFREFKNRGWKLTVFMLVMIVVLVGLGWAFIKGLDLDPAMGAGMFAGALSSTPGMAAVVEMVSPDQAQAPVVGYSLAYPGAVIGPILVAAIGAAVLKVNHKKDAEDEGLITAPLKWTGVEIREGITGTIGQLREITGEEILATRITNDPDDHKLADQDAPLQPGMILLIHGTAEALESAIAQLGEEREIKIEDTDLIYREYTVSNPEVAGHQIRDLDPASKGFLIARVRRADSSIVPTAGTVLNYSDRVRVVTAPGRVDKVRDYIGDSEKSLGNVDLFPFALGLTIGLLIGAIPIPLPGGTTLTLGFGGGPIVAGLILGAVNRTGPIHWQLPFHANRTISTLGLALFLAGVGTSAGAGFRTALTDPASLTYMGVGLVITLFSALVIGFVGMWLFKLKWDEAMGVAAGMTTNPAVISYLNTQTRTDLAERGYATVYPTTMIGKIVASQVLFLLVV
ncbi:aspartate:alanine exchanger family transporter [Corynebacterium sp. S7]